MPTARIVIQALVACLCLEGAFADEPTKSLKSLALEVPSPSVLLSSTGEFAVCVQETPEAALTRIVVVDLQRFQVVGKRDFPTEQCRVAVGLNEYYVANNDSKWVAAHSLRDLSELRRATLTTPVNELIVVADKLLCSTDGTTRLDLPQLVPSRLWAPLKTWKWANNSNKSIEIWPRLRRGWWIDGVEYDHALKPRLMTWSPHHGYVGDAEPRDGIHLRTTLHGESTFDPKNLDVGGVLRSLRSLDHPCYFEVSAEPTMGDVDAATGFDLQLKATLLNGKTFAQVGLGRVDRGKVPKISLKSFGHRVVVGGNGTLWLWELDEKAIPPEPEDSGPLRFVEQQPTFAPDIARLPKVIHKVIGTGSEDVEYSFHPGTANDRGSAVLDEKVLGRGRSLSVLAKADALRSGIVSPEKLEEYTRDISPFFERVMGRAPKGFVTTSFVTVRAKSSANSANRATLSYYVFVEFPPAFFEKAVQSDWKRIANDSAARKAQADAEVAAQQKRQERAQREATLRTVWFVVRYSLPVIVPVVLWLLVRRLWRVEGHAQIAYRILATVVAWDSALLAFWAWQDFPLGPGVVDAKKLDSIAMGFILVGAGALFAGLVGNLLSAIVLRAAAKWAENRELPFGAAYGTMFQAYLVALAMSLPTGFILGASGTSEVVILATQVPLSLVGFLVQSAMISSRHDLPFIKGVKISGFMLLIGLFVVVLAIIPAFFIMLVLSRLLAP